MTDRVYELAARIYADKLQAYTDGHMKSFIGSKSMLANEAIEDAAVFDRAYRLKVDELRKEAYDEAVDGMVDALRKSCSCGRKEWK